MTNKNLMQLLSKLNKFEKNKDLTIFLGMVTITAIVFCIHHYKKNSTAQKNLTTLMKDYQSLAGKKVYDNSLLRKQAKIISEQEETIKNLSQKINKDNNIVA